MMKEVQQTSYLGRTILLLMLAVLTAVGCMTVASADELEWNLLSDKDAGYRATLGSFAEATDENGTKYVYNVPGTPAALYVYDDENILGSYGTFYLEGDFYFESFPTGIRGTQTPKDSPLSMIAWIYQDIGTGAASVFNGVRIDDEGNLYTMGRNVVNKTDVKLQTGRWYNIRCRFTPRNGISELFLDGEKMFDFKIETFRNSKYKSWAVRYFDGFYDWGVKMKNLKVKTDSNYSIELKREATADCLAYQTTKPVNDTFSVRAVLGLDSVDFSRVGYEVLGLTRDEKGRVITESMSAKSTQVYEMLLDDNGTSYNINELFGRKYAAALEISDLPIADENFELVIRPYTLGNDGIRRYGISYTYYYAGETDDEGYPILSRNTGSMYTIPCTDDTFIYNKDGSKTSDFGSDSTLQFRNPGNTNAAGYRASYFKFTLDAEMVKQLETAASAKLRIYIPRVDGDPTRKLYEVMVHATATDWDEHSLNFQNHTTQATTGELIYQGTCLPASYFSADILTYLKEEMLNEDGSLTVSFRITNEGHGDALECYISSKETTYTPVIEISNSIYEIATNLDKMGNRGYEPWGYAEMLVDEWFDGLRDEICPTDIYGDPIYHEIDPLDPNGYGAKQATGDFTQEVLWLNNGVWTSNAAEGYRKGDSYWRGDKFARTLATLGTSTANTFLESAYAQQVSEYDIYGGITNAGFKGKATGFFHTEEYGGRCYVIDPLGNPYFAFGMNDVGLGSTNQVTYALEKYGTEKNYFNEITDALQGIGINTAFVSSNQELLAVENGLACAVGLTVVGHYMSLIGRAPVSEGVFPYNNTMNVFDPDFVKVSNENVALQIAEGGYADDPHIFGYTTDNELPSSADLLCSYLTLNPAEEATNAFSYAVAWTWLARRMETDYPTLSDYLSSPDHDAIAQEFLCFTYARYYKVARDAIQAADPNHMYLGSRVAGECKTNEGYHRAAGYYLDILTVNLYDGLNPSAETITSIYRNSGKPFIVTEFYAQSLDAIDANGWMLASSHGAGAYMNTQAERATYYENYVLALIESKACVGCIWYRFRDCDQSLYRSVNTGETVIMLCVDAGEVPKAYSFMNEEGTILSAAQVGKYDAIYVGNAINSNQNGNKGLYTSNFFSVVTVYEYDAKGKLIKSNGYEVETPDSKNPADGTVLNSAIGNATFTLGSVKNADGSVTETVLTVYEGEYVALSNSIESISKHLMGLVNYFDAQ